MTDIDQYKALLGGDAKATVADMIDQSSIKEDFSRWTGRVINNNDPERLGRVQVKIIGHYDNIQDKLLPWAVPDIQYMGSKNGNQIIPEIDTMVRGYFDKGDVQRPVYDAVAFNEYNSAESIGSRQNRSDYPHKMVLMETDQGDFVTLNRKDGTFVFVHRTGSMFRIDRNGNVDIQTGTQTKSNLNITINGDCFVNVSGNAQVSAVGDVRVDAGKFIDLGRNPAKQFVNNVPQCPLCGIMLSTQQQVRV